MPLQTKHSISDELHILREHNGIRLVKPNHLVKQTLSVKKLFDMPFSTYFYKGDDTIAKCNELNANQAGYAADEVNGMKLQQILDKNTALDLEKTNRDIIKSNQTKILVESGVSARNIDLSGFSMKFPWYGESGEILGVFGLSLCLQVNKPIEAIAQNLQAFIQTGLLTPEKLSSTNFINTNANLTDRQREISTLLVRGNTSKQIANKLKLSVRTVEHHIDKLKSIFNVFSKSVLIEKLFDYLIV